MITIEIDDDLCALDMALQDKIALATMRRRPKIGNAVLAKLLGVSDSGIRTLIRRFKATGLIKVFRLDGAREFRVLVGDQSTGAVTRHKLTNTSTPENRQKVTEPPPGLTPEERSQWKAVRFGDEILGLAEASRRFDGLHMAPFFAGKFSHLVQVIASDPDLLDSDRTRVLKAAETLRNFHTATNYVLLQVPKKQAPNALKVLREATQEQLAAFYERIQSGRLEGGNCQLLIELSPN